MMLNYEIIVWKVLKMIIQKKNFFKMRITRALSFNMTTISRMFSQCVATMKIYIAIVM